MIVSNQSDMLRLMDLLRVVGVLHVEINWQSTYCRMYFTRKQTIDNGPTFPVAAADRTAVAEGNHPLPRSTAALGSALAA